MQTALRGRKQAPPATLGARIAAARRAAGLTQDQLGQGMGPEGSDLGKGAISSWEVDRSQPGAAQVAILASRLGVSADYLLGLAAANAPRSPTNHPGQRSGDKPVASAGTGRKTAKA